MNKALFVSILGSLLFFLSDGVSAKKISKSAINPRAYMLPSVTALPELLERVEKKYNKSKALSASFVQVKNLKAMGSVEKSGGTLKFKRPNKIRWEFQTPEESLLVSNGKKFWYYTPPFDEDESAQVIITDSSKRFSEFAQALLAGNFSVAKNMKIQKKGESTFQLVPPKGKAGDVTMAEIVINTKNLLIETVRTTHVGGNTAEIKLQNIKLGESLKDNDFEFKVTDNMITIVQ